jgi:hypothetical protein
MTDLASSIRSAPAPRPGRQVNALLYGILAWIISMIPLIEGAFSATTLSSQSER